MCEVFVYVCRGQRSISAAIPQELATYFILFRDLFIYEVYV